MRTPSSWFLHFVFPLFLFVPGKADDGRFQSRQNKHVHFQAGHIGAISGNVTGLLGLMLLGSSLFIDDERIRYAGGGLYILGLTTIGSSADYLEEKMRISLRHGGSGWLWWTAAMGFSAFAVYQVSSGKEYVPHVLPISGAALSNFITWFRFNRRVINIKKQFPEYAGGLGLRLDPDRAGGTAGLVYSHRF